MFVNFLKSIVFFDTLTKFHLVITLEAEKRGMLGTRSSWLALATRKATKQVMHVHRGLLLLPQFILTFSCSSLIAVLPLERLISVSVEHIPSTHRIGRTLTHIKQK